METEVESDNEFFDLPPGELAIKLSGNTKARIRSQWANALIVKVFGKTVGYNYLHSRHGIVETYGEDVLCWLRTRLFPY